ncbi:MAG: glucose-6-phosphate dehydrogenase [Vallitaleaceae bacterium]|nr:glucose-6-phosphate dehydrogenase [Vallitaleaceae bacterium]
MDISNAMIIFGGTGDLTKRKLIPALYNLLYEKLLPEHFFVVSVGRREKTYESYIQEAQEGIKEFSRNPYEEELFEILKKKIYYYQLDFDATEDYLEFDNYICALENKHKTKGNRLFYLAVSPEYFGVIVEKLHEYGLASDNGSFKRVVIEKPFGRDLESAKALSKHITHAFGEENIYRIDHYLGKEMLQNIMVVRFANAFFEPIWNNKYIDHIQITSTETLGVEERGGYYEKSGALKDMLQNHLLQLLALTAMEPPVHLDTESIRDEKVKVFKGLRIYTEEEVEQNVVRGQYGPSEDGKYVGYRQESRTHDESEVETFIALKAEIENFRWSGVPFYIRTGKRMKNKCVEVIVQFKSLSRILYLKELEDSLPNQLIIRIQPTEGIYMRFNAKKPGQNREVIPVTMDFCQNCEIGYNSPEAYERLLLDAMKGEKALFTRWDEVEYSWRFVDAIQKVWEKQKPDFPNYAAGSFGPDASEELLTRDGRKWHDEI